MARRPQACVSPNLFVFLDIRFCARWPVSCAALQRWDLLTLLCLLFTALVTPVEVAFLTTNLNALFIINRVVDAVFVVVSGRAHGLHRIDRNVGTFGFLVIAATPPSPSLVSPTPPRRISS